MGTLKFSSTLKQGMYVISGQRVSPFGERLIISVSFEDYSYSAISPIGRAIPDVGLTNRPLGESDCIPKMAI